MEEEKAAAYYDELSRKGEGAAKFKQGLGFSSSSNNTGNSNDAIPTRGSALISSSSFLSSFVRESSPSKTTKFEKQCQLQTIQNKLKKKPRDDRDYDNNLSSRASKGKTSGNRSPSVKHSSRRSRSPSVKHSSRRSRSPSVKHSSRRSRSPRVKHSSRRSRSPSIKHSSRRSRSPSVKHSSRRSRSPRVKHSSRRSRSRSRDDERHSRPGRRSHSRNPDAYLLKRPYRSRSRSRSRDRDKYSKRGRQKEKQSVSSWDPRSEKVLKDRTATVDYSKLIDGYEKMTPAERVKAKMKLQLSENAQKDETKGMGSGWERFDFDKDAPLDDEEIEAVEDDGALVNHIGRSFRFSAVETRREEQIKAAHDEAIFGAPSLLPLPPSTERDDETEEDNGKKDISEIAPATSLISGQALAMQQGSWRDRARRS